MKLALQEIYFIVTRWHPNTLYLYSVSFLYCLSFSNVHPHTSNERLICTRLTVKSFLHSNTTLLNSKVVTVIVKPTPTLLSSPVEIEFPHLHNVSS